MQPLTPEKAREMQAKSVQARLFASDLLAQQKALADAATIYVERRRARVRLQLERIDDMMMKENDPQRLDRLASAQNRLSEQERILDGRPLPGSNRPRAERATRSSSLESSPAPADPTFTPQPSVSPEAPQEPSAGAEDIVGL